MNGSERGESIPNEESGQASLVLSTDAIRDDGYFDPRYTCELDNSSPELRWENVPAGTESFALLAEDIDSPSGPFAQWVVYNISKSIQHLPAGIPPQDTLPNGIRQGLNSLGKLGYAGPCPPIGANSHRYVFRIFALRVNPDFPSRINRESLLLGISDAVLATAEITGLFRRAIQKAG